MKYIAFTLIVLLCLSGSTSACAPTLYAVCRITLLNGNSKEGIIRTGGDCSVFWMNGFRFEGAKQTTDYFLTLEFSKFMVYPGRSVHIISNTGRSITHANLSKSSKILFLQGIGYGTDEKESPEVMGSFFRKPGLPHSKYEIYDSLTLFAGLTDDLFLPRPSNREFRKYRKSKIPLNQVASLELLKRPSRRWLTYIKQKRKTNPCLKEPCEDYIEPAWYHEILADKEKYKHYKETIEESVKERIEK